jgi:hypothetical protein
VFDVGADVDVDVGAGVEDVDPHLPQPWPPLQSALSADGSSFPSIFSFSRPHLKSICNRKKITRVTSDVYLKHCMHSYGCSPVGYRHSGYHGKH